MFDFLSQKFNGVLSWVKGKSSLTEKNIQDALNQVKDALLEADVPLELVEEFLDQIKNESVGKKITTSLNAGQQFIKIVHDKLLDFLGGKQNLDSISFQIPSVVMVMGLQGSGKTTTIAKIANWVLSAAKKKGKQRRILLSSVDFYRPAAIEQLKILSKQINVDFYESKNTNVLAAADEIYKYFKSNSYELLFLDTAGRFHIDDKMMTELQQINKLIFPKYKFLVLDAMTGQESLNVAKTFDKSIGFDYSILSKMDSDTRGGAAFAFRYALKKPIAFVGSGEKIDDLESFISERMASRILGMGDILTLIEKASEKIDLKSQENISGRMFSGKFTLQDFADQMGMVNKMGSLQGLVKMLPGMGSVSSEMLEKGQEEMKSFKSIISSMTIKERLMPDILNASRKQRIAKGAGVLVQDINRLLERFDQSRQFAKMFKTYGKLNKFFR
ncbi:MAG: signal recognition particle protein [bacterium]